MPNKTKVIKIVIKIQGICIISLRKFFLFLKVLFGKNLNMGSFEGI